MNTTTPNGFSERDAVLSAIRRSLGKSDGSAPTLAAIAPRTPHPRLALGGEPLVERWTRLWTARAGTFTLLPHRDQLPEAVTRWCAETGVAPPTHASGSLLDLPWPQDWTLHCAPATVTTETAVSEAYAGVAEVGSIVFLSAPIHPTTHRFVPDNQLVVLSCGRIAADFEAFWALLRQELGEGVLDWRERLPRTINFVAGPSRTGDVEQTIQLGAHGPRRVHVFLIP